MSTPTTDAIPAVTTYENSPRQGERLLHTCLSCGCSWPERTLDTADIASRSSAVPVSKAFMPYLYA